MYPRATQPSTPVGVRTSSHEPVAFWPITLRGVPCLTAVMIGNAVDGPSRTFSAVLTTTAMSAGRVGAGVGVGLPGAVVGVAVGRRQGRRRRYIRLLHCEHGGRLQLGID